MAQVDQPIAVLVGQRLEQHGADDAEDRRVGPDAERQGQDGHRGEGGAVPERAQGEPGVGGEALEPRQSALIADRLGGLGETSRREQRLPARLGRSHAAPDVLGGLQVEMGLQLLAEIGIRAVSGEESDDARERGAKLSHGVSRRVPRKAAIRSAV